MPSPSFDTRLAQWKNQLIDTTKRNRLLFFSPTKSNSLHLTYPAPETLFNWLVVREKPLTFIQREEEAEAAPALDLGLDDPEDSGTSEAATPPRLLKADEILTDRTDQQLKRILYNLRLRGRTAIAEQGVNIMFVAFGLLDWMDPAKQEQRCSPLVLVPVELRRRSSLEPYQLFPVEEDVVLNPTLTFLLGRDCNISLPPLPDDLDTASFDGYCTQVERLIRGRAGWAVRKEAHLGTFSFQKLVIYNDLEGNTDRLLSHPIVRALAGDPEALGEIPLVPDPKVIDDHLTPGDAYQVLDADSSQQAAIEAVKGGLSLVLQGPPGTGKSQTIANLIAETLAAGKRVLFVSEKMAALQVVHSRLKARGLNDFCLEVHSAKTSKLDLLRELGRVLTLPPAPSTADSRQSLAQLRDVRDHLNRYARALHRTYGAAEWTPFSVHGRLAALHHARELDFKFKNPLTYGPNELARLDTLLTRLEGVRPEIANCEQHPWRGCLITEFNLDVQTEIHQRFGKLRELLQRLQEQASTLAEGCRLPAPTQLSDVDRVLQVAEAMAGTPRPPAHWFQIADLNGLIQKAESFRDRYYWFLTEQGDFLSRWRQDTLELPLAPLLHRLTAANEAHVATFQGARDYLWQERRSVRPKVDGALRLVDQTHVAGLRLCELCEVTVPCTLLGLRRLLSLSALAATDPRPTQSWFSRASLRVLRDLTHTASEVYPRARQQRADLLSRFDPGILNLELDALVTRFSADFTSLSRIVRPSYWRDMRQLRGLQKLPGKLTVEAALADLRLAREVRQDEQWIAENEGKLDAELGAWFQGHDTRWPEVLQALDTTKGILDWFGQSPPTERLVSTLMLSGDAVLQLRQQHHLTERLVTECQQALRVLMSLAEPSRLPVPVDQCDDTLLTELSGWLTPLHAGVEDFWNALEALLATALHPETMSWRQAVADVGLGCRLLQEKDALGGAEAHLRDQFGHLFAGTSTDWQKILTTLLWTGEFIRLFEPEEVPLRVVDLVSQDGPPTTHLPALLTPTRDTRLELGERLKWLTSSFTPMIFRRDTSGIEDWSLSELDSWLELRVRRSADLERWIDFRRIQQECEGAGLGMFLVALMLDCPEGVPLRDVFYRRFYRIWLDEVHAVEPCLRNFRGWEHTSLIRQFQELDRAQWEDLGPKRVRHRVMQQRREIGWVHPPNSEPGILKRELEKRRRHKPLRQLFTEIPNLLQELKPCLLMSPMTVSQLLDPNRYHFHLVIFDEASQICAEDAVGAIYRGDQLVVAGDRHQLPPTRFFTSGLADGYDSEEEEAAEEDVYESILDQCRTMLPVSPLRWHYRSRHESLIAFSNAHIYSRDPGERLKTFPSACFQGVGLGVELVTVPDGVYDRKRTRRNVAEARKVASLVIEHMRAQRAKPDQERRSLGVVAFSEAQQLAILSEVEALRLRHRDLDDLFDEGREEPFFVKNLENVQGDERDIIILNVGYARDADGTLYLNFGPLNRQGGERRLNVAITRAKYQVKLVSSLTARDIDLGRTQSRGVHLLRAYLDYAERGARTLPSDPAVSTIGKEQFREVVRVALQERGHAVEVAVGMGGHQIDLAIVDPNRPGNYLLGIECDGREFAGAATARDRDRLVPSILAGRGGDPGLGWRLHRVWSADWTKDPDGELVRIEAAITTDSSEGVSPNPEVQPHPPEPRMNEPTIGDIRGSEAGSLNQPERIGVLPYQRAVLKQRGSSAEFYVADQSEILQALKQVIALEGPLRLIDATRRVAAAWEIRNMGSRVKGAVAAVADVGVRRKVFRLQGEFLWPKDMTIPPVRSHEGSEDTRSIEAICPEEIAEAVMLVMHQSFGLPEADVVIQTARTLGFGWTGGEVRDRIADALNSLVTQGRLTRNEGVVSLPRN